MDSRRIGVCPGTDVDDDIAHLDDQHYAYLGYALLNDSDVQQFTLAYQAELADGGDFSGDLVVASSYGGALLRLRDQVERTIQDDPENTTFPYVTREDIPVMVEWPGNHEGYAGGHVLYMDGHVEWHDYPGEFPMTEATISALDSIAHWTPTTSWRVPRFPGPRDDYEHGL